MADAPWDFRAGHAIGRRQTAAARSVSPLSMNPIPRRSAPAVLSGSNRAPVGATGGTGSNPVSGAIGANPATP